MHTETDIIDVIEQSAFSFASEVQSDSRPLRVRDLLTKRELADYLGCGISGIDGMTESGLPSRSFCGEPIYSKREIEAWLRSA